MNNKEKLSNIISNIEQLGADSRFYNNYEDYNKLRVELISIRTWVEDALKVIEKIEKEEDINE